MARPPAERPITRDSADAAEGSASARTRAMSVSRPTESYIQGPMDFENEFDVEAPIDEVYAAMLDLERVAPAMPGAEVLEKVDDDNYKVGIKVKVGPVSMQYRGDVTFVDKDAEAHSATLKVK